MKLPGGIDFCFPDKDEPFWFTWSRWHSLKELSLLNSGPPIMKLLAFEFAPIVNHHVERDLLDSVVTRTY